MVRGKQILSKILVSITAWPSFHWSSFVKCFVYNKTEIKLMHISNHIEYYRKKSNTSQAQNTTALQPKVFLPGIQRLQVTCKGWSACLGANHCHGPWSPANSTVIVYWCLHVKYPIFSANFNQILNLWEIVIKRLNIKFHVNPSSWSCADTCGQTDGHDDHRCFSRLHESA